MFTLEVEENTESFYSVGNSPNSSFMIFVLVMVIVAFLVEKYRKD